MCLCLGFYVNVAQKLHYYARSVTPSGVQTCNTANDNIFCVAAVAAIALAFAHDDEDDDDDDTCNYF